MSSSAQPAMVTGLGCRSCNRPRPRRRRIVAIRANPLISRTFPSRLHQQAKARVADLELHCREMIGVNSPNWSRTKMNNLKVLTTAAALGLVVLMPAPSFAQRGHGGG